GFFCFFFQAEDGIRDFHVTGVQTCALPICLRPVADRVLESLTRRGGVGVSAPEVRALGPVDPSARWRAEVDVGGQPAGTGFVPQIGRASCRERVWMWVVGGAVRRVREGRER